MELKLDYFKIEYNNVAPAKGKILISEPFLQDAYFNRSVVLITSDQDGFVGFVLNKFAEFSVHETVKGFPEFNAKISIGGPVRVDTIHFIHTLGEAIPESVPLIDNLWWGGDFEHLRKLVAEGFVSENQVRFFLGYSGWDSQQLERELVENSWLVADLNAETIMNSEQNIWKQTLDGLGSKYRLWSEFPENPTLN